MRWFVVQINANSEIELSTDNWCAAKPPEHHYRMWSQRKVYNIEKITRQNQKVKWQNSYSVRE